MSNFEKNIIDLGEVLEKTTIKADFKVVSNRDIIKVETSCGCTPATFNKKSVVISYRTGYVPVHLQSIGKSEIAKFADVFFNDLTSERIYLKATLIKRR